MDPVSKLIAAVLLITAMGGTEPVARHNIIPNPIMYDAWEDIAQCEQDLPAIKAWVESWVERDHGAGATFTLECKVDPAPVE